MNDKKAIIVGYIEGVRTRKDKSVSLAIGFQETDAKEAIRAFCGVHDRVAVSLIDEEKWKDI